MGDNCPICGKRLGKLNKAKIKDEVIVCTDCMGAVPFKEQMKRGNGDFSLEEIKKQVEMKAAGKKSIAANKEESTANTGTGPRKPKKKKWLIWVFAAVVILGIIGNLTDDDETRSEEPEEAEVQAETANVSAENKEQKMAEKEAKEKEEAEKKEKERKANRSIAEALEEDSNNVDEASMNGDELTLKHNPGTVWSENSFMATVYDMFEDVKTAFDDEDINSVIAIIETTMTDEKGNESLEPIIKYDYSRDSFEELNYENFTNMAYSEEWRILREADYYYIHPGIYKNLKDKYKDHLNVEGFN